MHKPKDQVRRENLMAEVAKCGGEKEFADKWGENVDFVRQLAKGKAAGGRNIGDRAARRLEGVLGKPANWLDQDWSSPAIAAPPAGADAERDQTKVDIDALRHAVDALYAALATERPAEGARVAAAIRDKVPEQFVRQGYIKGLLQVLDKAARRARIPGSPAA